jgi:hypothetical protein
MECYQNLPLWKKLVGYEPETFGILMMQKKLIIRINKYLIMQIMSIYIINHCWFFSGFLLSVVIRGIRRNVDKPYIIAI